jgi:capsular exopolysaccharide synthesis family protein
VEHSDDDYTQRVPHASAGSYGNGEPAGQPFFVLEVRAEDANQEAFTRKSDLNSRGKRKANKVEEHVVCLLDPTAFETEQYRTLRTHLELKKQGADSFVVAVSSPGVGDGKTLTAINIAAVLAERPEARVLLIDADLRNPSIGSRLGLSDDVGLGLSGAVLDETLPLEGIFNHGPSNLSVLPAGRGVASPYELFQSQRFSRLLATARLSYNFVVVDTPPMVFLPDCRVIGNSVDGFLIVVAANRTPKRLVEEACKSISPTNVLGFIFNLDERPAGGYYYYYPYAYRSRHKSSKSRKD